MRRLCCSKKGKWVRMLAKTHCSVSPIRAQIAFCDRDWPAWGLHMQVSSERISLFCISVSICDPFLILRISKLRLFAYFGHFRLKTATDLLFLPFHSPESRPRAELGCRLWLPLPRASTLSPGDNETVEGALNEQREGIGCGGVKFEGEGV